MRTQVNVKSNGQGFFAFKLAEIPFSMSIAYAGGKRVSPYKVEVTHRKRRQVQMPTCLGIFGESIAS
jgi:hypothetical protein